MRWVVPVAFGLFLASCTPGAEGTGTNGNATTGTTGSGDNGSTDGGSGASGNTGSGGTGSSGGADAGTSGTDGGSVGPAAPAPVLQALSISEGRVGASVTVSGSNFGASAGTITLNGVAMTVVSWSDTSIVAKVPSGAGSGPIQVTSSGSASNAQQFTVTAPVTGQLVDGSPNASLNGNWAIDGSGGQVKFAVAAAGRSTTASFTGPYGGFPQSFTLELPVGTNTFTVQEKDSSGNATVDLLQSASRQLTGVVVGENGLTNLQIPVLWHWELNLLDPGFPVCNSEEQIQFSDADHGMVTFQVNGGVDPTLSGTAATQIHGAAMVTSDGGKTWTVASHDISTAFNDFRPSSGSWFANGYLYSAADGTVLSADGLHGSLARSADGGATWQGGSLNWQSIGPGDVTFTRFAQAGSTLYVSSSSGGVQGSYPRQNLLMSTDRGATWQVKYDVCGQNYYNVVCPNQVPKGFGGLDMACSDVDDKHCISMGDFDSSVSTVLVTTDGFATVQPSISPACGVFTGLTQVIWVPGTLDACVVAGSSCPGTGTQVNSTTDGGLTWSGWSASQFPGRTVFADSSHAVSWWDWGVRTSADGAKSWLFTGKAPSASGQLRTVDVLDATHMWVLGHGNCSANGKAFVARWVP